MRFAVNETIRIPSKTKAKNEQSLAKSEIKSILGTVNNIALSKKLLIPGEEGIDFEKFKSHTKINVLGRSLKILNSLKYGGCSSKI